MDTQTQAQIYLADQRGCSRTEAVRSYHTFNVGGYVAEGREPFGTLLLLNDDTLRAGASLPMRVETGTRLILIPVVGGLEYAIGSAGAGQATGFLEPGQVGTVSLSAGKTYSISNPYETQYIRLIQLWLTDELGDSPLAVTVGNFDLTTKNKLLLLFDETNPTGSQIGSGQGFIGQFDGRQDGFYTVKKHPVGSSASGIFVFVLNGVFEVANRLLHEKDGLSLRYKQGDVVEFEALSNEAILLLLEIPLTV